MATDQEIANMPIEDVVKLPGGNGLASPPFRVPSDILSIYEWKNIDEGIEAIICEGKQIPKPQLKAEFLRLIEQKNFVRRVLIKPATMKLFIDGSTRDTQYLQLSFDITYEIRDPVKVTLLSDPLKELRNIIQDISSEYINNHPLIYFIHRESKVQNQLKGKFNHHIKVNKIYNILHVSNVTPSDGWMKASIVIQSPKPVTRNAVNSQKSELEERLQPANLRKLESYSLDDKSDQLGKEWEKELKELEDREEILKTAIKSHGLAAESEIDSSKITKDVIDKINWGETQARADYLPQVSRDGIDDFSITQANYKILPQELSKSTQPHTKSKIRPVITRFGRAEYHSPMDIGQEYRLRIGLLLARHANNIMPDAIVHWATLKLAAKEKEPLIRIVPSSGYIEISPPYRDIRIAKDHDAIADFRITPIKVVPERNSTCRIQVDFEYNGESIQTIFLDCIIQDAYLLGPIKIPHSYWHRISLLGGGLATFNTVIGIFQFFNPVASLKLALLYSAGFLIAVVLIIIAFILWLHADRRVRQRF